MRFLFICVMVLCAITVNAQIDTIYTNSEKIPCSIKEVTPDAVQYVYPNETVVNSLYKNMVRKIVFRSGRIQVISESILSKVNSIEDYAKVTITQVEGEIKGLYKLGEVSASSRGGSVYSNIDRVKERALNKLKMESAMRGANIVYMAYQKTDGNKYGGYFQASKAAETIYTGVAYSDYLPKAQEIINKLKNTDLLTAKSQIVLLKGAAISKSEYSIENTKTDVRIIRVYEDNGQIFLDANIKGFDTPKFRVVRYDNNSFTLLAEDKNKLINFIVPFSS